MSKDENDVRLTEEEIRNIIRKEGNVSIDSDAMESIYTLSVLLYDLFKQQQ